MSTDVRPYRSMSDTDWEKHQGIEMAACKVAKRFGQRSGKMLIMNRGDFTITYGWENNGLVVNIQHLGVAVWNMAERETKRHGYRSCVDLYTEGPWEDQLIGLAAS